MTDMISPATMMAALGGIAAGLLLGLAYFASLARVVSYYMDRRPLAASLMQAGRFLVLAGVLVVTALLGVAPLLGCATGILIGRQLILRSQQVPRL